MNGSAWTGFLTLIQVCVFLKLNAKERAVCWFCSCEEDGDVELV